jgi:tRNA-dihydrouridine synthase A
MTVAATSRLAADPPQLMSIAPMMDWTDLHYRQLARLLSRNVWLYTEMVVDSTLIHNPNHDRFLWFPEDQHPIVCQLGGSNPDHLAEAAKIVARYGYDEINLNCGCPSDRVAGAGCFGAALMLRPDVVARCCAAMAAAVEDTPITVKCRLGVDDVDSYEALSRFISTVSTNSPVRNFHIHARKCHLKGLNPHQNRTVPPLRYHWVWALKRDYPHLEFFLNGGVVTLDEVAAVLGMPCDEREAPGKLSGVMVGRAAYNDPWSTLANADVAIWGAESNPVASRRELLDKYAVYADSMLGRWGIKEDGHRVPNVRCLTKPLLGLFHGAPKSRQWRAAVDGALRGADSVREVLDKTLHVLLPETLDAPPTPLDGFDPDGDACKGLFGPRFELPLPSPASLEFEERGLLPDKSAVGEKREDREPELVVVDRY